MSWKLTGILGDSRVEQRKDGSGSFCISTVFDGKQTVEVVSDAPLGESGRTVTVDCDVRLRSRQSNGQTFWSLGVSALKKGNNNPVTAANGQAVVSGAAQ